MAKQVHFGDESRSGMLRGVRKLYDAVRVTMGPKGRNVILNKSFGGPVITNDGVTIAKEIELEDVLENMGAQLVKEAATKTNDVAGDGTTTATVLAFAIITEGLRNVIAGANPMVIKLGIMKAVSAASDELSKIAKKISGKDEIAQVATISAQDPVVGDTIAEVMERIGNDGVVSVEEGQRAGIEVEYVEGMQFDNGFISPYMMTDPSRMEAALAGVPILITDKKISAISDIVPILEKVAQKGSKMLLIIADDVDGEALATLVLNKLRGAFTTVAVKAPGFGDRKKEMLKDIAALTGATIITEELGRKLDSVDLPDLGSAKRVIVTKDSTTIIEGKGDEALIESRKETIKAEYEHTTSDYDKEKLAERLAKLSSGVAVIKVGATTEVELKERKHRTEDALSATRAAVEEGVVPGGGTALVRAAIALESFKDSDPDIQIGIDIVKRALLYPIKQIAHNSGFEGSVIADHIRNEQDQYIGFDASKGVYGNMMELGIIDPKKVTRSALENAASVAAMFLTTEASVSDLPKKDEAMPAMDHMHGGGMY